MARPVKETPILTGKDARRFEKATKANENKRISLEEQQRIIAALDKFEVVNIAA
jgi:hypothetical protein